MSTPDTASGGPTTKLATHTNEELYYRDDGLVGGLMGNVTFTEMMFMHIMGRKATPGEIAILDASNCTLARRRSQAEAVAAHGAKTGKLVLPEGNSATTHRPMFINFVQDAASGTLTGMFDIPTSVAPRIEPPGLPPPLR